MTQRVAPRQSRETAGFPFQEDPLTLQRSDTNDIPQSGKLVLTCKPLMKWPGGKSSELSEIVRLIPGHNRYFEPFFGGGSVFFDAIYKPSFVNDINPDLMGFYRCVKKQEASFFKSLDNFLERWESRQDKRKSIYLEIRERYNNTTKTTPQKIVDFFILREFAFGGMFRFNSSGEFNVPFGNGYANKNIRSKIDYLRSKMVRTKMNMVDLYNCDFEVFMRRFTFSTSDFMFVDPPYNCSFTKYGADDFFEEDQRRLATALLGYKGKFMLVCQYTPLIKDLYKNKGLFLHAYEKRYKFNIKGRFNQTVKHLAITNYDQNF